MYMYIYKTTNRLTGEFYIGQHSGNNKGYIGSGKLLKKHILEVGIDNFDKEIIEYCPTKSMLNEREIYWIERLKPTYNLHKGGIGGYNKFAVEANILKRRGKTWEDIYSEEGLIKMQKVKNNFKEAGTAYQFGNISSSKQKEIAKKGGKSHLGKRESIQTRQNISKGIRNSQKHKAAMASPAVREKISKSVASTMKEKWKDPGYREKVLNGRYLARKNNPTVSKENMQYVIKNFKTIADRLHYLKVSITTYYKYRKLYIR